MSMRGGKGLFSHLLLSLSLSLCTPTQLISHCVPDSHVLQGFGPEELSNENQQKKTKMISRNDYVGIVVKMVCGSIAIKLDY